MVRTSEGLGGANKDQIKRERSGQGEHQVLKQQSDNDKTSTKVCRPTVTMWLLLNCVVWVVWVSEWFGLVAKYIFTF